MDIAAALSNVCTVEGKNAVVHTRMQQVTIRKIINSVLLMAYICCIGIGQYMYVQIRKAW